MTWYKVDGAGRIVGHTNFEGAAREFGFDLSTDRAIVTGPDGRYYIEGTEPAPVPSVADYDRAMEDLLMSERVARGYTTRSPAEYSGSRNARWAQDAADWVAHVTDVMEYALAVENAVAGGQPAPALDDFVAGIPRISWTFGAEA